MKLTFYNSKLCPRCARVRKHLKHFLGPSLDDYCVDIDVAKHPVQTWRDGIRMIPALKFQESVLSGVMLSQEQVRGFLAEHDILFAAEKS